MKFHSNFRKVAFLALALALMSFAVGYAHSEPGYTFKVHNNTQQKIVKLLASADGKNYGQFDIGDGIAPGQTMTLEWDKSTDNTGCYWYFKAEFDDKEQSQPVKFNFCEKNLELEF